MAIGTDDAVTVLGFWLDEVSPERRFAKDPVLDKLIEERFGALREAVLASDAKDWRDSPARLLAAIILLDQFSRNIHRGNERAFAADPLARSLALQALDLGWEDRYTPEQLRFLYLPLAHAEDNGMQALSVARYEALRIPEALEAAREHAEVVRLYGRFPSRNEALSRRSTPAEVSYLRETTHRW